ncbi:MAG: DJ-1/PfpI family protein [Myxococcota bacterium]
MRTHARRVAVIVFDEVELLDVAAPLEVLSAAGRRWNFRPFKLELLAPRAGLVTTRNQTRLEATGELAQAAPAEVVIVPGGYGARRLAEAPADLAELTRIATGAELVAAVGNGVLALARAGLCGSERIAVSSELATELEGAIDRAACDTTARLVEGTRVLTATATGSALELGLAIIRRTFGSKMVSLVAAELGLDTKEVLEIRY